MRRGRLFSLILIRLLGKWVRNLISMILVRFLSGWMRQSCLNLMMNNKNFRNWFQLLATTIGWSFVIIFLRFLNSRGVWESRDPKNSSRFDKIHVGHFSDHPFHPLPKRPQPNPLRHRPLKKEPRQSRKILHPKQSHGTLRQHPPFRLVQIQAIPHQTNQKALLRLESFNNYWNDYWIWEFFMGGCFDKF